MQHGDDYLSYSDDLVKAMSKSTDNVDTMIKLVSDFGDTAENAIVKSGDHAVDIYERFGENGLKAVANYGDDAVEVIYDYGSEAVTSLNKGIDPASVKKIYNWDYRPNDETYLKYKSIFDDEVYYNQRNGAINWPDNDGFVVDTIKNKRLSEGTYFKRYGGNSGEFLGNTADSFESRSLAPHSDPAINNVEIHYYELIEDTEFTTGKAAPWFGQPGGADQFVKYKIDGTKYTIQELEAEGILIDITNLIERGEISID